jgi:esterase/lipase
MSSEKPKDGWGSRLGRFFGGAVNFLKSITAPLWMGWRYILAGDPEFPDRYRDWSENMVISARSGGDNDPWIYWLGGYSATVAPFKDLVTHMSDTYKVNVVASSLAGHTGSFWDFATVRSWDWYLEAEKEFLALQARVKKPIIVAGISTGGLVALLLAARHPDKVKGVITDAAALRLKKSTDYIFLSAALLLFYGGLMAPLFFWLLIGSVPLLAWLGFSAACLMVGSVLRSNLVPPEAKLDDQERVRLYHSILPVVTTSTLPVLQLLTWVVLPFVRRPTLVCHGVHDYVIPVQAGRQIFERLGSSSKCFRAFQRSSHPVLLGPERDEYLALITRFAHKVWADGDVNDPASLFEEVQMDPTLQSEETSPDIGDSSDSSSDGNDNTGIGANDNPQHPSS